MKAATKRVHGVTEANGTVMWVISGLCHSMALTLKAQFSIPVIKMMQINWKMIPV